MNKPREIEDLPENFVDIITDMMKTEGASIKEVCAELNITPYRHGKFMKDERYKQAFEDGVSFAEAWWMTQGRKNLENKSFNVGIYAFQMKNRYKWRDTPLIVGGNEKKPLDKYHKQEILGEFEKGGKKNEKSKKVVN
jgi:hypothetical protein